MAEPLTTTAILLALAPTLGGFLEDFFGPSAGEVAEQTAAARFPFEKELLELRLQPQLEQLALLRESQEALLPFQTRQAEANVLGTKLDIGKGQFDISKDLENIAKQQRFEESILQAFGGRAG